jgi:type IV pilus assembly protein PilQ
MRVHSSRIICHAFILIFLLVFNSGCVKRMMAAKDSNQAAAPLALIQGIKVSDDASQIEISTNSPLTYTSYKVTDPPKIVVDLAQTEPGTIENIIDVNSGNIKQIQLSRQGFTNGVLTRIEISLNKDQEFAAVTDPKDKGRLLISFEKSKAEEKTPVSETDGITAAAIPVVAAVPATIVTEAHDKVKLEQKQDEIKNDKPEASSQAQADNQDVAVKQADAKIDNKDNSADVKQDDPLKSVTKSETKEPATETKPEGNQEVAELKADSAKAETSVSSKTAADPKATAPKDTLSALKAIKLQQDGIELIISGGIESVKSFKLSQPDRFVIDIPGAKNSLGTNVVPINDFGIGKARVGIYPEKLRIVFDAATDKLPPHELVKGENSIKILLTTNKPMISSEKKAEVVAGKNDEIKAANNVEVKKSLVTGKGNIDSIDFKIVDGNSRVAIKINGECSPAKLDKVAKGVSLNIGNCQLPKYLQRSINAKAFNTPVTDITPYQVKTKRGFDSRILVKVKGNPPYTMKQDGNILLLDVKNPMAPSTADLIGVKNSEKAAAPVVAKKEVPSVTNQPKEEIATELSKTEPLSIIPKKVYKGRKVSLEFSDADVRKIFQLIAEVSNLNFLIADDVGGTISIKLVNVPWDQALDVILETKGLEKRLDGNIMNIKPKGKFKDIDQELAEKRVSDEKLMELRPPRVFEINYANVADIEKQFKELSSKSSGIQGASVISDNRTNRIIVVDNEIRLKKMEDLLAKLDTPERQVMIEARIVEASNSFTRDLGVQWGAHYADGSASIAGISRLDTGFGGITGTPPTSGTSGPGATMGMSFGRLLNNIQLDMRLSAAASIGQVKIISTPKIVTLNNKSAKISQGQSIPYQTVSAEGTKTEFVEAALTLDVTPHITPDGSIGMKIRASNNSPGSGTPPPINKKEATTELLVKNNETTVIGGIYVDSENDVDQGVPFFQDIPLLGWLFKSNQKLKTKTELLIFITPKIIN